VAVPLSWLVHDAEEVLTIDRWQGARAAELAALADRSRLARRIVEVNTTPRRPFAVAVALVGVPVVGATVAGTVDPAGAGGAVFAVVLGGYALHAFVHVGQSVHLRGYTPGVVTAVAVVLPSSAYLYRRLFEAGLLDPGGAVLTAVAGLVVFVPVVVAARRLAARLVP
jgi:hypothetical protein